MNPVLLTPPILLRDAALMGALLTAAAAYTGQGVAVGLGALVGLVNLLAWIWATSGGASGARIVAKQLVAPCLLVPLWMTYPPMAVFLGFCSVILAIAARAVVMAFSLPVRSA